MIFLRKVFFHSPKRYIAAAVTASAIAIVALFTRGHETLVSYGDAISLAGGAVFFLGLLFAVAFYGAFETFAYAVQNWSRKDKHDDFYEYIHRRADERKNKELTFMPFVTVGMAFFLIGSLFILCG